MPSPFPGMNPYLEHDDAWHDFHERFAPAAAEVLAPQVHPNYIVKIDERVYVHDLAEDESRFVGRPDVYVARGTRRTATTPGATAVLEAPVRVRLPAVEIERLNYVQILDRRNRQLVTVVELLSPSNKTPGDDRDQYLAKRAELLASSVNLVEIDLLRGGPRMPCEDLPDCDYCVMVSRVQDRPEAGLWPIALPNRLPEIPVPLRPPDGEARLDLQAVLHRIYDAAGYEYYIYDSLPSPPLSSQDAAWAQQFVPARA